MHAPVLLLEASRPTPPVTWGYRDPKVLLPPAARDWTRERAAIVLRHELAHVRRRDWLVQLGAMVVRSLFWFHPLVWIACAELRLECERACDDAVLRSGVSGTAYAGHLLELARGFVAGAATEGAAALARRSTLECRVRAMLADANRAQPGRTRYALVGAAIVALSIAGAGFGAPEHTPQAVGTPPPPRQLTLMLDGQIVDLSKGVPSYPIARTAVVPGPDIMQLFNEGKVQP